MSDKQAAIEALSTMYRRVYLCENHCSREKEAHKFDYKTVKAALQSKPVDVEPYKNSCDHCGTVVDKKWWTFNLEQCVVCETPECKKAQKDIFNKTMNDGVEAIFQSLIKEDTT